MDRTRASDAERERVVAILRDAATHGRIEVEELDERSAETHIWASRRAVWQGLREISR